MKHPPFSGALLYNSVCPYKTQCQSKKQEQDDKILSVQQHSWAAALVPCTEQTSLNTPLNCHVEPNKCLGCGPQPPCGGRSLVILGGNMVLSECLSEQHLLRQGDRVKSGWILVTPVLQYSVTTTSGHIQLLWVLFLFVE